MSENEDTAAFLEKLGTVIEIDENDLETIKRAEKEAYIPQSGRLMSAVSTCLPEFWSETRKLFAGETQFFCQRRRGIHKTLEPRINSEKFKHDLALFLCGISPLCSASKGDLGIINDKQAKISFEDLIRETRGSSCCYVKNMFQARLEVKMRWKKLADEFQSLEANLDRYSDCTICEVNSTLLAIYNNIYIEPS